MVGALGPQCSIYSTYDTEFQDLLLKHCVTNNSSSFTHALFTNLPLKTWIEILRHSSSSSLYASAVSGISHFLDSLNQNPSKEDFLKQWLISGYSEFFLDTKIFPIFFRLLNDLKLSFPFDWKECSAKEYEEWINTQNVEKLASLPFFQLIVFITHYYCQSTPSPLPKEEEDFIMNFFTGNLDPKKSQKRMRIGTRLKIVLERYLIMENRVVGCFRKVIFGAMV